MQLNLQPIIDGIKNHWGKGTLAALFGASGFFGVNYIDESDFDAVQRGAVTKVFNQEVAESAREDYLKNYMFTAEQINKYGECEKRVTAVYDANDRTKVTLLVNCLKEPKP